MKKTALPSLPDTGRHYVEGTRRARLASPGLERFVTPRRGSRAAWAIGAVLLAAASVAAMVWLS
jgi:hypothetical protein